MPRLPWSLLSVDRGRTHLVVASMPAAQAVGSSDLQVAQSTLLRLLRTRNPAGAYATAIERHEEPAQVAFAFEREEDARLLADAIQADATDPRGGWASRRAVELEAAQLDAIAASLPPPRTRPR
jgi:hypothetical protein